MGWWAAKVRRFTRYFLGRVGAADREPLRDWLTPAQLKLFESIRNHVTAR